MRPYANAGGMSEALARHGPVERSHHNVSAQCWANAIGLKV